MRPHRQQPTRLLCLWDSPGKNTGVGCQFPLQCTKVLSFRALLYHPFGLLWWLKGKEPACQHRRCKRHGFDPWVRNIPWRRKWQPTPVFLPGESHGQKSIVGCRLWGHTESDTTEATYAFDLWCWRRLLRVPWTARRSNPSTPPPTWDPRCLGTPQVPPLSWSPHLDLAPFLFLLIAPHTGHSRGSGTFILPQILQIKMEHPHYGEPP